MPRWAPAPWARWPSPPARSCPPTLAAVGVAAALGLARWRVTIALACALAGLAALGELPLLAVAGCCAALWVAEPEPGPHSDFSPVVLAAILAYAATALTLLVVGQFVSLPPVAATLATVTVLTGMARAGLTIVDRLRATERDAVTDDLTGLGNRRHLLHGWPRRSRTRTATSRCC